MVKIKNHPAVAQKPCHEPGRFRAHSLRVEAQMGEGAEEKKGGPRDGRAMANALAAAVGMPQHCLCLPTHYLV